MGVLCIGDRIIGYLNAFNCSSNRRQLCGHY